MKIWLVGATLALNALLVQSSLAQEEGPCGGLANAYGPFDYRKEHHGALAIVDRHHFNSDVQSLRRGQTAQLPGGDLDYTLRASPNHHLALATIAEWGVRTRSSQPPSLPRSIDCYFERATRFQRDDYIARMLYASYLQRTDQSSEALRVLEPLEKLTDLDPYTNENLGLLLLDLKQPERALAQAWKADAQGWSKAGLKERLRLAGQWREPPAAGADPAASAPPAHPASAASAP